MAENTKIEWTTHTFNPWRGCTKVAEGCANCYAEREAKRFPANRGIWGPNGTRVLAGEDMWAKPLKWNREAECNCGAAGRGDQQCPFCNSGCERPRVFCASLADVFESWDKGLVNIYGSPVGKCRKCGRVGGVVHRSEWERGEPEYFCRLAPEYGVKGCGEDQHLQPATLDDVRRELFKLIDATPNLDWLLLTKRPENIRRMLHGSVPKMSTALEHEPGTPEANIWYRPNVWLGTSVSTQADAEKNVLALLQCRQLAPVLFISAEPLLERIDFSRIRKCSCGKFVSVFTKACPHCPNRGLWSIDLIIPGGESGPHARPCNIDWIRSIVKQTAGTTTACFVKQLGSKPMRTVGGSGGSEVDGIPRGHARLQSIKDSKGGDMAEWDEDLRVRQMPGVRS